MWKHKTSLLLPPEATDWSLQGL